MAARLETRQHIRGDATFIAALLLSMGLHAVAFYLLPGVAVPAKSPEVLSVELPAPPKPLPLPEPPKPQPLEKPKTPQKKPLPPKPQPVPQAAKPVLQAHEPEPAIPEQPPVIAATPPPQAKEPPNDFVVPAPPQEPPPRPKGPSEQDIENARGNYSNLLSREFAKYKQYPHMAQMRGWQGTVKVELHIDAAGNIRSSTVIESSNFEVLDKQALEMVRKASPLPQPPESLRGREFTIVVPVAFRLE